MIDTDLNPTDATRSNTPQAAGTARDGRAFRLIEFNPDAPGAPVIRKADADPDDRDAVQRKLDRRPVVRYGPRGPITRGSRFTKSEQWLINRDGNRHQMDYFLLGTLLETDQRTAPLAERTNLRRLIGLSYFLGADVLIESNHVNKDLLAVLGQYALRSNRRVIFRDEPRTNPHARSSAARARYRAWSAHLDEHQANSIVDALLGSATTLDFVRFVSKPRAYAEEALDCVGAPTRHADLARLADRHLTHTGWNDREIRDYLSLHGFVNTKGGLGIWNHNNLMTLRETQ